MSSVLFLTIPVMLAKDDLKSMAGPPDLAWAHLFYLGAKSEGGSQYFIT